MIFRRIRSIFVNNQNFRRKVKHFTALIFILFSVVLSAQLNPEDIYVNAKEGEGVNVVLNSVAVPNIVVEPSAHDSLGFDPIAGTGQTTLHFAPVDGFIGDETITVEYFVSGGFPGIVIPNYTTIHYRVKSSKIDLVEDYSLASVGTTLEIDVLVNDTSSDGALTLERLGHVEGGTASIVSNKIHFDIDADADLSYIRYFVSDATGNIEGSKLYIQKKDNSLVETREVFVDNLFLG